MTKPPLVEICNLHVELSGKLILENVSVTFRGGDRTALVGPNGGGKTTLVRTLLGFIEPAAGEIKFRNAGGEGVSRPRIGYLPQRSTLAADAPVTAEDVVSLALRPGPGFAKSPAEDVEVRQALTRAGLSEDLFSRPVGRLSGGQRQRVLLARALVGSPSILILDEPDTALDSGGLRTLRRLIAEEVDAGKAVVYVTHDSGAMGGADVIYRIDGSSSLEEM